MIKAKFTKNEPTETGMTLILKISTADLSKAIEHELVDMRGETVKIALVTAEDVGETNETIPRSVIIDGVVYFPVTSTFEVGISTVGVLNLAERTVEE